jgi:hypothetical protein
MTNTIRPEVYQRIVLAKALLKEGSKACATRSDQIAFTRGILILHDAAEAGLGAVADHLHAKLPTRTYLLDYYQPIQEADPHKRPLPYRTQVRNLNVLRVNAKHQGILPDPSSNAHFPGTVEAFLEELCQTYLGLALSRVSLKALIRNETISGYVDDAEKFIDGGKIEEALIALAYAMYHICETTTIPLIPLPFEKAKEFEFTRHYSTEQTVNLLEHGVDPYLYHRFKNLTPKIARHTKTRDLVYKWDTYFGHPGNWTVQNARFCLDFCIDTALRFQREEGEAFTLLPYPGVFEDIIEPAADELVIWDQSMHTFTPALGATPPPRTPKLALKKGQSIVGWASDHEDRLDEWFILSRDIPSDSDQFMGFGYATKAETKLTRREIQQPKEMPGDAEAKES